MTINSIPEFDMPIPELHVRFSKLAEQKMVLCSEMIKLDSEMSSLSAIMTVRAMEQLNKLNNITDNQEVPGITEAAEEHNKKVLSDLQEGKIS